MKTRLKINKIIKVQILITLMFFIFLGTQGIAQTTDYFVNVKDFGAKGDGITDDTAAIQAAVDSLYVNKLGGGTVYFPPGKYRVVGQPGSGDTFQGRVMKNGIYLRNENDTFNRPTDVTNGRNNRVTLRGAGKSSVIQGDSDDLIIIRVSAGYATIKDLTINGGVNYGELNTGVVGIGMVPDDMQEESHTSKIAYNLIENVHIGNTQEGILMMCGPGASTSACYWNSFTNISLSYMVRGIYLASGVYHSPSVNRNHFENINMSYMNVGFHIESGDTNTCVHCSMTDIILKETPYAGNTPREIPTAIVIDATDKWEFWGNANNRFYSVALEGNPRDIDNAATRTEFYGLEGGAKDNSLWTSPPAVMTGGNGNFFKVPGIYVGNKTMDIHPRVALGADSSSRGFLPPRMTTGQRDAMGSVPEGLMIYNTSTHTLNVFSGGSWKNLSSS